MNIIDRYFKNILIISFLTLLFSHICLKGYIPNILINIIGIIIISFFIFSQTHNKDQSFKLILIIFICSNFNYAPNFGGLFNIIGFAVVILYIFLNRLKLNDIIPKDKPINFLLFILILFNALGWLTKNPSAKFDIFIGAISFFGYISVFYLVSSLRISKFHIALFIKTVIFINFVSLFFALNNRFFHVFTSLKTPLFWIEESRFESQFFTSMIGHSELYGEFGLLSFLLITPFFFLKHNIYKNLLKQKLILSGIIVTLINLLLSFSRSAFLLLFLGLFLFFLFSLSRYRVKIYTTKLVLIILIFIAIIFTTDLNFILLRLSQIEFSKWNISAITTGEGINRGYAFSFAYDRLNDESWNIGYGWGTKESNRIAWFVNPTIVRADYHSLYLSLPMLYGWVGSIAFVLILLVLLIRMVILIFERKNEYFLMPSIGFFLLLCIFIINEYKISALRLSNYHMLVWIWLGFINSIWISSKRLIQKK